MKILYLFLGIVTASGVYAEVYEDVRYALISSTIAA